MELFLASRQVTLASMAALLMHIGMITAALV
jgi:hypothetical protein